MPPHVWHTHMCTGPGVDYESLARMGALKRRALRDEYEYFVCTVTQGNKVDMAVALSAVGTRTARRRVSACTAPLVPTPPARQAMCDACPGLA